MKDPIAHSDEERLQTALSAQKPIGGLNKPTISNGPDKPIHVGDFEPKKPKLPRTFLATLPSLADQWAG